MSSTSDARLSPPTVDQSKWEEDKRKEMLRVALEYERFNQQQSNPKHKVLLLFIFSERQRTLLQTIYEDFPTSYKAEKSADRGKRAQDSDAGRLARLEEDVDIVKYIRRVCHEVEGTENPMKRFNALPKLSNTGERGLVDTCSDFVEKLQAAWFDLPVEVRGEFVQNRESMVQLIQAVLERISAASVRSYFNGQRGRIQAMVSDPAFPPDKYPALSDVSDTASASDAASELEEKVIVFDRTIMEMALTCERRAAVFEGFIINKTQKMASNNGKKQYEEQLAAKELKITKLKERITTLEQEGKRLRDELKSARGPPSKSGLQGGRGDGPGYESWHYVGRGRGGRKPRGGGKPWQPSTSAVHWQQWPAEDWSQGEASTGSATPSTSNNNNGQRA